MAREKQKDRDGKFELSYRLGAAMLTVFPPQEGGRPVYADEVAARMKLLGIPWVRTQEIQRIVDRAEGKAQPLVQWPEGAALAAHIEINIGPDSLWASATVHPPRKGGGQPREEDILSAVVNHKIHHGIDRQAIKRMAEEQIYDTPVIIARGERPRAAGPARVEYLFNTEVGKPFLEDEQGRVNLKELNFISNVKQGDVLARLLPRQPGSPGMDVFGKRITFEDAGEDETLRAGKNTRQEGDRLLAIIDGNAYLRGRYVNVDDLVIVDNVDYQTGNIDVDGSVLVHGTIADGFTVRATGMIQVEDCIGRVQVEAGGTIVLKAGMNGNGEGSLTCSGDIYARFIENARLECRSHLVVEEAIMNSTVLVWKNIYLTGKRAELIGGSCAVGGGIQCKKLGNFFGVETVVEVGIDPEVLLHLRTWQQDLEHKKDMLNKSDLQLQAMHTRLDKGGQQTEEEQLGREKLQQAADQLSVEIRQLQQQIHEARQSNRPAPHSKLIVQETAFTGTVIRFGSEELRIKNKDMRKTVFRIKNGAIHETGYNPAEPERLEREPVVRV